MPTPMSPFTLNLPRERTPGRRLVLLGLLAAPLVHAQATGIRIVHSQVSAKGSQDALRKILVLGWGTRQDLRQLFEDTVALELRGLGVEAAASYTRLSADEARLREAVKKVVKAEGYDAVLVARLIATERAAAAGKPAGEASFEATLERNLAQLETKAAPTKGSLVAVTETSLYRVTDGARVWSALTDVQDPKDLAQTTRDYASTVAAEMRRLKLV